MTGMRPIVDVMFGDFITLTMDQMVNQAAKAHYMSGGKIKVPIVFRTTLGATRRSAAQHSQSLHAWVSHVPGLKVALPSDPYEAKGLMKTRDPRRQSSGHLRGQDDVPGQGHGAGRRLHDPLRRRPGQARGARHDDRRHQQHGAVALGAAKMLDDVGISAEVIDPRTTWPLDKQALINSAKKTSRAIVVDEGYERYGVTAEIASIIGEGAFYYLDAPVKRIGAMDVPVPFSPVLEDLTVPSEQRSSRWRRRSAGRPDGSRGRHHARARDGAGDRQGLRWLKQPGERVEKGEPLVEIETDKITVEIESPASGVLGDVSAREGDVVPVGQTIAVIIGAGETARRPRRWRPRRGRGGAPPTRRARPG